MKELEKVQVFADGRTSPEIISGSPILLIQDGTVRVGKLNLGDDYNFNMEIEHPTNEEELNPIVTELIGNKKPEYLKSKMSIIVLCPKAISDIMKWN